MRHGKTHNHLSRKSAHRKALLKNLACALFEHKRIKTTIAKAKALRVYVEPLITKSKDNSTHSRRVVFSNLQNKEAIKELFGPIAEKVADRPGGYVRIVKLGFRRNDGTEMAIIELVDFNEIYNAGGDASKASKRRSRRGSGKSSVKPAPAAITPVQETVDEVDSSEEDK
jgi:large subunit ribosomal protein L17